MKCLKTFSSKKLYFSKIFLIRQKRFISTINKGRQCFRSHSVRQVFFAKTLGQNTITLFDIVCRLWKAWHECREYKNRVKELFNNQHQETTRKWKESRTCWKRLYDIVGYDRTDSQHCGQFHRQILINTVNWTMIDGRIRQQCTRSTERNVFCA